MCVCVCFKGTTRELCVGGAAKEVTVANRAEFVQLLDKAMAEGVPEIWVEDSDRMTRDVVQQELGLEFVEKKV